MLSGLLDRPFRSITPILSERSYSPIGDGLQQAIYHHEEERDYPQPFGVRIVVGQTESDLDKLKRPSND